jgi:aldehyde dehydrogenase (NAD(P)+)
LDSAVTRLRENATRFARLTLEQRIELANTLLAGYLAIAEPSVHAACAAKGIPLGTPLEGEEWALGPWMVVRHLRLVRQSLLALQHTGKTEVGKLGRTADGRLTVQVFPAGPIDGMLFNGVRVDVHLQDGITEKEFHATRARFYKRADHVGAVVLVLGAGNINAIVSHDVITKMFNEGRVCLIKMNPVNAYFGPFLEVAFRAAITEGFVQIVYGGADEGAYLVEHPGIDEIHITGSDRTYDQIVWGAPGPERDARKARGQPLVTKPITAELGNVSPVLVVPGTYPAKALRYQGADIAGAATCNASFNCNAAKMVVTGRGWVQRAEFLAGLEQSLSQTALRQAYYPGAQERWHRLAERRRNPHNIGVPKQGELPWSLVAGLDANDRNEPLFSTEAFCGILGETELASSDPVEFLDQAVTFANERLWGTLSAGIVIDPKMLRDPRIAEALERAILRLRYGAVTVNAWSGYVFAFGTPPWGAHPSSSPADIQSGTGWVHNTSMIEGIEKAVLRHPLVTTPRPSYQAAHRTANTLMRRMTYLEEQASWSRVPGVLAAAMRA